MSEFDRIGTNDGHGHAWKRPDGAMWRCGGVAVCLQCAADFDLVVRGMHENAGKTVSRLANVMLPQLLIATIKQIGGVDNEVRVSAAEVDASDGFTLSMRVDPVTQDFFFVVERKP